MEKNKPWIINSIFFLGTIILVTEITRIHTRQISLDLIEKGSYLYKLSFVNKNEGILDFNHLFSSYFPLIVFLLSIVFLLPYSRLNYLKKLIIIWITTIISFIITFFISEEYFVLSKSWYFSQQIGMLICFSIITGIIIKERNVRNSALYFFSGLLIYSFFTKALEPLIMKLQYDLLRFPFGKIDLIILGVYLISTSFYLIYQKKTSAGASL